MKHIKFDFSCRGGGAMFTYHVDIKIFVDGQNGTVKCQFFKRNMIPSDFYLGTCIFQNLILCAPCLEASEQCSAAKNRMFQSWG